MADTDNNRVQVFTSGGVFIRTINPPTGTGGNDTALMSPRAVAVDEAHNGNVVVADNVNNRIQIYTWTGNYVGTILPPTGAGGNDTALNSPNGAAVDPANSSNVLVADSFNNRVQVYTNTFPQPTPAIAAIPTLDGWTGRALAALCLVAGLVFLYRRR